MHVIFNISLKVNFIWIQKKEKKLKGSGRNCWTWNQSSSSIWNKRYLFLKDLSKVKKRGFEKKIEVGVILFFLTACFNFRHYQLPPCHERWGCSYLLFLPFPHYLLSVSFIIIALCGLITCSQFTQWFSINSMSK